MSTIARTAPPRDSKSVDFAANLDQCRAYLHEFFGTGFTIWNGLDGQRLGEGSDRPDDPYYMAQLVQAVSRAGEPQFVVETDGVLVLAVPIQPDSDTSWVATAPFAMATSPVSSGTPELAQLLGRSVEEVTDWFRSQNRWPPDPLLRMAKAVQEKLTADREVQRLQGEVDQVSQNLASTYEEISLLYTVTQNLRISSTEEEIGQLTLEWLVDCIPAHGFAIQFLPRQDDEDSAYKTRKRPELISNGLCPLECDEFSELVAYLQLEASSRPFVANHPVTGQSNWPVPSLRQLIVTPLSEGEHVFGWLAALNHRDDAEFGTVEANLLNSVSALLGIHSSNRELYRQQSEMVANVVRALVSAIDAKDPYTSGHSDRVSRFAVRIALEMRCDPKLVNTIYMAGLLHDVGKIGIDDSVLRKAGRLTESEFAHIKQHPEMGFKILADIKQLGDVLPAVLHHHEQWDGRGYPHGLSGEDIPQIARIMAVADAYDAMTSDRPYRAGMPDEKVDDIFRDGTGDYWDPEVVAAYFRAKKDIEQIRSSERNPSSAPVSERWVSSRLTDHGCLITGHPLLITDH